MSRLLATAALAAAAASAGCVSGDAPVRPAGQLPYDVDAVPVTERPVLPAAPGGRPLVVCALADATLQPVGGAYDEGVALAPLRQTYFSWALGPVVTRALYEGLRDAGVRVYLDDLDVGRAVPFPSPPYPPGLVALRGTIDRFTYDRWTDRGRDVLVAELSLRLVDGASGTRLWHGSRRVEVAVESEGEADPFERLGQVLAARLLEDSHVHDSLRSGPPREATIEAGAPREEGDR